MIVDTSALLAILFDEPDAQTYASAIADADTARLSAAGFVEAATVVEAQTSSSGRGRFDAMIRRAGIVIEPVTEEQAHIARQAYADFGKGRHPAATRPGLISATAFRMRSPNSPASLCSSRAMTSERPTSPRRSPRPLKPADAPAKNDRPITPRNRHRRNRNPAAGSCQSSVFGRGISAIGDLSSGNWQPVTGL